MCKSTFRYTGVANIGLIHNKYVFMVFVWPIFVSMIIVTSLHLDTHYHYIIPCILIYAFVISFMGITFSDLLANSLHLRFKREELMALLATTNQELRNINLKLMNQIKIRRKVKKMLYDSATHDHLTKLPNRTLFAISFDKLLEAAKTNKTLIALFFIDLDHFKNINDTYGHDIGDKLLVKFSHRLQQLMKTNDLVVRFGGDEFCVALDNFETIDAIEIAASRFIDEFARPYKLEGITLSISASIGVAICPIDGSRLDILSRYADAALIWAKNSGRNNYKLYDKKLLPER